MSNKRNKRENKSKKSTLDSFNRRLLKRPESRFASFLVCLALVAVIWLVFGQTLRHDFVNFDDNLYVYDSPLVVRGLSTEGIIGAFTHTHAHNWHPLTTVSHMLDCQLYRLNAGAHHLTNVILHTIAVLLLFLVLKQMTAAFWQSAFVAALFAIHPLHVESVAWIAERKDVLSAVFFMLTLGAYACYVRAPTVPRYLLVALAFAFGLMSKPMLVTLPFVLLLLDYWPLGRLEQSSSTREKVKILKSDPERRTIGFLLLEKIPLFVLSAAACFLTFVLQKRTAGAIPPLPFLWRAQNAVVSYVTYAWKALWPTHLAVFYPHPNDTLPIWGSIFAMLLLLAITAAAIRFRSQRPYLFTGWFWYLVMLVPVIGLVQVGEQGHADRYTYLPSIGLFLVVVWFVADVALARRSRSGPVITAAVLIALALMWAAFIQTSYWRNSETLWTHALSVTSDNDVAHNNLGYLCDDRGELDKAISHFERAANIRSGKLDPHYDLASAFVQMNLADALAKKGQSDEAMIHYEQAIRLQPNYAEAYYNRSSVLFAKGRTAEAAADLEKVLEIQPNDAEAHTALGNALLQKGSLQEAIAHYEKASALAPEDPHSRNNLAWVLATSSDARIHDGARAVRLAHEAVKLSDGREPSFLRTLAAAYAEDGRFSEAAAVAKQAVLVAKMQGKTDVAKRLEKDLVLYRELQPVRDAGLTNASPR